MTKTTWLAAIVLALVALPAAAPGASAVDDTTAAASPSDRPALSAPVATPNLPVPSVSTDGPPTVSTTQRGVRIDLWSPSEPVENGDWVSTRLRVTNVGRTPILVPGYPDNLLCHGLTSSLIDLTGLWEAGRAWEGNAQVFRDAYLDEGPAVLDLEPLPGEFDGLCLDIGVPDGRLEAGGSFEMPFATWLRYIWRDQPLPSGTAELVSTFRFQRPSREPGMRRGAIELRAPLEVAGADVSYPSPQELVDAALTQPDFLAWLETRRFDEDWNPAGHRLTSPHGLDPDQQTFGGGPAPLDTIQVGAFAEGSVPENWGRVTIDPWDGSVKAVEITG